MISDPFASLALIGAERLSTNPPAPHPALAEAWAALDWTQREKALLDGAALLASARHAGAVSLTGAETAPPCAEETLPLCGEAAAGALRRMWLGDGAVCLPEWLDLAARAGRLCPPRDLPALLDKAAADRSLRTLITPVLGQRGLWLARQKERWRFALESAAVPDDAWETGSAEERLAWLRQTQETDPARAAAALAAVWPQEGGDQREAFLETVHVRPDASLTSLLEQQALKDRRGAVRALARAALMRLPGSDFSQRAIQRATPLLKLEGMLMMKRLTLALPEAFDPAWKNDGLEEKPPAGLGPRAWWARQILGAVPLSHWARHFGVEPAKLVALNRDDESREIILLGWLDALGALPEAAFAAPLVRSDPWPKLAPPQSEMLQRTLRGLTKDEAAQLLEAVHDFGDLYWDLLLRTRFPIPAALARVTSDRIVTLLSTPSTTLYGPQARELALRVPASEVARVIRTLAALPSLTSILEEFLRTLEFRQSYIATFTS